MLGPLRSLFQAGAATAKNLSFLSPLHNLNFANKPTIALRTPYNLQQSAHYFGPNYFPTNTRRPQKKIPNAKRKRQPITTKRAGKGFYKGNRGRKEGFHTSKGKYQIVPEWRTDLVVPDLKGFKLKPYVGTGAKRNIIDRNVVTA